MAVDFHRRRGAKRGAAAAGARRQPPRAGISRVDREIIVVSDGSVDAPRRALARVLAIAVRLIEVPAGGKPLALNAGVARRAGEILVFADARQRFAAGRAASSSSAISRIPSIGGVTGELVLDCERRTGTRRAVGEGIGLYWKYEKWMRRSESRVWSTLGATGAIYALRRALLAPAAAGDVARRRAGADARGAGRLPHRVRRGGDRLRSRQRRRGERSRGGKHERWPATTKSSRWSRDCCSRSSIRSGCSICRTRSGA